MKEYNITFEVNKDEFIGKDLGFTESILCQNLLGILGSKYTISKSLPENNIVALMKEHPYYFSDILSIDGEIIKIKISIIEFESAKEEDVK